MRDGRSIKKVAIVTTSWDDGHPLDVRLAELLASYDMPGTFYVPLQYHGHSAVTKEQILTLRTMGMEIGSHTLTHPDLTKIGKHRTLHELRESKHMLEDILSEPIVAFCYPEGKFNGAVRSQVIEAGYKLARTTLAFRTGIAFDPFRIPVSFQFFPHTSVTHIRHTLKEVNLKGLINWCRFWQIEKDLVQLTELMLNHVLTHGGILHIWGHSWEIEQFGLWGRLKTVCGRIARHQSVLYLTNAQVLDVIAR
jgi:peptidoglycan/xylan/chitin deacetylase (PgdA/CDA1 family)